MDQRSLEVFLRACGSSEPLRVGVGQRNSPHPATWTFPQPFLVIGRRPESDLVLDHWQVSRRHCYLQLIEGRYYCVDLGSRTGTHGGDATERSGWLEPGRSIQVGPFSVRPGWPDPADRPEGSLPGVTWEVPGRAIGPATWRMDRHLALVGRSPSCKIRIVEPDVSKFHCSVVLTVLGVWAVDLLGHNGVFVNGRQVRCARLEDGDELRVGRHTLRARYDDPPPPLPRDETAGLPAEEDGPGPVAPPALLASQSRSPALGGDFPFRLMPPAPPPSGGDLAAILGRPGGAVDPSVNLLFQQFALMQQQMFDQFHRTMMMMFEGFAAIHREQTASIREEFERVRELSREIEALRAEVTRLAEAAARPPARPGPSADFRPGSAVPSPRVPAIPPVEPTRRAGLPGPAPGHGPDIHAQLCLRLATIESERQNRWQKILGMMSSRS